MNSHGFTHIFHTTEISAASFVALESSESKFPYSKWTVETLLVARTHLFFKQNTIQFKTLQFEFNSKRCNLKSIQNVDEICLKSMHNNYLFKTVLQWTNCTHDTARMIERSPFYSQIHQRPQTRNLTNLLWFSFPSEENIMIAIKKGLHLSNIDLFLGIGKSIKKIRGQDVPRISPDHNFKKTKHHKCYSSG